MTWFDAVAILAVIAIAWIESVRGFGRALFDFVGAIIALQLSMFLAPMLADTAPLLSTDAGSEAFWLAIVFFVMVTIIIIATKYIYESTLLSLDVLDPLVGAVLGIASGLIVAHIFMKVMITAYTDTDFATVLLNSFVGQEIIQFRTYHHVVETLQNIGHW